MYSIYYSRSIRDKQFTSSVLTTCINFRLKIFNKKKTRQLPNLNEAHGALAKAIYTSIAVCTLPSSSMIMSDISWASVSKQCLSSSTCVSPLWQSLTARFNGSSAKKLYLRCSMTSWYRSAGTSSQCRPADDIPLDLPISSPLYLPNQLGLPSCKWNTLRLRYNVRRGVTCASERRRATDSLRPLVRRLSRVRMWALIPLYCAPGWRERERERGSIPFFDVSGTRSCSGWRWGFCWRGCFDASNGISDSVRALIFQSDLTQSARFMRWG